MAEGLQVVGSAPSAEGALAWLEENEVDVLVVDEKLPDQDYTTLLKVAHQRRPHVKILLMGEEKEPHPIEKLRTQGLSGYLLRQDAHEKLVSTLYTLGQQAGT